MKYVPTKALSIVLLWATYNGLKGDDD